MNFKEASDDLLVNEMRRNNRLAFNALFQRYWDYLFQVAYKFLKDEDTAKDAVQEVFYDLWVRRGESAINHLKSYLYQAVRYQALKQLRKIKLLDIHEEKFEQLMQVNNTIDQLNLSSLQDSLVTSLKRLPDKYREIFEMSRYDHLSNKEIAEKLNISQRTVDWYLHSVIKHLKTTITSISIIFLLF